MEEEPEMDGKSLFNESLVAFKKILNILDGFIVGGYKTISREYGIDFFDDEKNFYLKLLNDLYKASYTANPIEILNHELNQRNLILLIQYIEQLSQVNEQIYKEPLIKINLAIIFGYFTDRFGKKFVDTEDYFYLCLKEIKKYFPIKYENNETKFDEEWKKKAKFYLKKFEEKKIQNIMIIFSEVKSYYEKKDNLDEFAKVGKLLREFMTDIKNKVTLKQLEEDYLLNPSNKQYINDFLEYRCEKYKDNKELFEAKKTELYKRLIFQDILNLDLENIEESLFLIYVGKLMNNKEMDFDEAYKEYKNNYKNLQNELNNDLTDELKSILDNSEFLDDLLSILESNSIKDYLEKKRKFNEENNNVEFVTNNDAFDDDLSKEYHKLLNILKNDKNWLKNKVLFKNLPKYKRAIVNPLMRILVNPLYIEISELLKKDTDKRKIILKAYLIIILIHEIIHLLKFFKEKFSFEFIPNTPKNKEGGEVFIEYLFGIAKIKNISLEQANIINEPNNWNDILNLHQIFENEIVVREEKKEVNVNSGYCINFYNTDLEEEEDNLSNNEEKEQDDWYDY